MRIRVHSGKAVNTMYVVHCYPGVKILPEVPILGDYPKRLRTLKKGEIKIGQTRICTQLQIGQKAHVTARYTVHHGPVIVEVLICLIPKFKKRPSIRDFGLA